MEPFTMVSTIASVLTLVNVASAIVRDLHNLKHKWNESTLKIISVRTQIETFRSAFEELYEWMNSESWRGNHSAEFIRKLSESVEGCTGLLCALQLKVSVLNTHPHQTSRKERFEILWNDSSVKDISQSLQCQATALILLIQCRTLAQQDRLATEPQLSVLQRMSENTALIRRAQMRALFEGPEDDDDTSTLTSLFETEEISNEEYQNSVIYSEQLMSQFESLQMATDVADSASTTAIDPFDELAGIATVLPESSSRQTSLEVDVRMSGALPAIPDSPKPQDSMNANIDLLQPFENLSPDKVELIESLLPAMPALEKFRILIIGQTGVGKSTLCSKILGIDETKAGVRNRGVGTPIGKVWKENTFPGQNDNLIIHDSGGFEAGSVNAMAEIQLFITTLAAKGELADQLHCIWYCISCASQRPIQEAEKLFFSEVKTGPVPVIVVFTQYDRRVKDHFMEWMDTPEAETKSPSEGRKIAARSAYHDWENNYKDELLKLVSQSQQKTTICRVGFSRNVEIENDGFGTPDELGTSALITRTFECLHNDQLRAIWMIAQRQRADYLLRVSIDICIDHLLELEQPGKFSSYCRLRVIIQKKFSKDISSLLSKIWNLDLAATDLVRTRMRSESGDLYGHGMLMWLPYSIYTHGTWSVELIVPLYMVTLFSLIFERLFWARQAKESTRNMQLTGEAVRRGLSKYYKSQHSRLIAKVLFNILFNDSSKANIRKAVHKIISVAKVGGELSVDPNVDRRMTLTRRILRECDIMI